MSDPKPYRSIAGRTRWLVALVAVQLAAAAGNLVAMVLMRLYLDDQDAAPFVVARLIVRIAVPTERVAYLASLVLFCFWVHRSYANLVPLGSMRMRFTPGWAVGYFFIPVVVFVRGVQVMRDLWIDSQPLPVGGSSPETLVRRAPLVGWWWAMWIVTMLSSRIGEGTSSHMTRAQWLALNNEVIAACAVDMVTGLLFIAVLVGIARRQRDQWDDLVRRQPLPPRSDLLR